MPKPKRKSERVIITPDKGAHDHHHSHHHHIHPDPSQPGAVDISVQENFMERNRALAEENRNRFDRHGIRTINVLGSVGSGKTSLIEAIVQRLENRREEILVIAGDVTTTIDSDRIAQHDIQTIQINTGVECHLDARLIEKALHSVDLSHTKIILIENVGNLICPADFPLGSHQRVVVVSVTEGPWMVQKHPVIIYEADVLIINKIDLADVMQVDINQLEQDAKRINPNLVVLHTSVRNDVGINEVIEQLKLN